MPTVAQYQPDQVRTQVAGPTRASTVNNGLGNLAQGINEVAKLSNQMAQEASIASAQQAVTQFERDKNDLFFNPETGYFNTQGRNAVDGAKGVTESLEKLKQKYGADLDGTAQREFDRVTSAQVTRSGADIMRHSSKNLRAWQQSNIEAEVENTLENASLYSNNLKQLDIQRVKGRQSVIDSAQMQGLSPEATNEKLQNYDSAFAMNIIKAETMKSADAGDKAMEMWGKGLEGPDLLNLQDALKTKREVETDKAMAQESVLRAGNLVSTFGDRTDARTAILEEVNKIEDADMRKRVMGEATYQLNLKQQADAEERGEIFEVAEGALYRGESMEQFKAKNPESWAKLSPKQQQALQSNAEIQTDFIAYTDLKLLSRDELAKINPSDYITTLAKTEYKELVNMVKDARNPTTKGDNARLIGQTRAGQVKATVDQLYPNADDKDLKEVNRMHQMIDAEYRNLKSEKGRELTNDEFNKMLLDVSTEYTIKQSTFGVDWLNPDDKKAINDIDDEQMEKYSTLLSSSGLPVTPSNIMRLYVAENSEK